MDFSLIALIIVFAINALSVKTFGETEYWLSAIKITVVVLFLIIGFLSIFGIMGGHIDVAKNLSVGNHGFVGGLGSFTTGGGILGVLLVAGFSFKEQNCSELQLAKLKILKNQFLKL